MGALITRAPVLEVCSRAPEFWKLTIGFWVAVKEHTVCYHNPETILYSYHICIIW